MKILLLLFLFYFIPVLNIFADTLYLKNGRQLEGLVRDESASQVELDVGFGTVTFEKKAVERITRSSSDEIGTILQHWQEERKQSELMKAQVQEEWNKSLAEWKARKAKQQEEASSRPKEAATYKDAGHLVVKAVLNNKYDVSLMVDTGASLIVLTPDAAKKLKIDTAKDGTPVQLITASGQKTDAKYIVLESVKISDVEATNVEAAVLLDDTQEYGFKDGLLGMSFLRRYNFKFDYTNNKLVLEKLK